MNDKKLTHNDFLQRLDIRDVLLDAGYRQNRRFGLRLSSFIRTDSEEKRIRGDKFVITQQGKCCCQPPRQKEYNVVSFIKEHPALFAEYYEGIDLNRLVNLVCSRLLNIPFEEYEVQTVPVKQDLRPFDITDYDLHRFNPQDHEMQEIFYPYFKNRGIDLSTQNAFHVISAWQQNTAQTCGIHLSRFSTDLAQRGRYGRGFRGTGTYENGRMR